MIVMIVTASGERPVFTPVNHAGRRWDQPTVNRRPHRPHGDIQLNSRPGTSIVAANGRRPRVSAGYMAEIGRER